MPRPGSYSRPRSPSCLEVLARGESRLPVINRETWPLLWGQAAYVEV